MSGGMTFTTKAHVTSANTKTISLREKSTFRITRIFWRMKQNAIMRTNATYFFYSYAYGEHLFLTGN